MTCGSESDWAAPTPQHPKLLHCFITEHFLDQPVQEVTVQELTVMYSLIFWYFKYAAQTDFVISHIYIVFRYFFLLIHPLPMKNTIFLIVKSSSKHATAAPIIWTVVGCWWIRDSDKQNYVEEGSILAISNLQHIEHFTQIHDKIGIFFRNIGFIGHLGPLCLVDWGIGSAYV